MKIHEKIKQENELIEELKRKSRPIVMTNGVFDILHRGHVTYLAAAAKLGATLLVAINTDKSVRMLGKGPNRPINTELDRAFVLAGLEAVDLVTFFSTKTPIELISKIKPDIYVKGADYDMEKLEESKLVKNWGGTSVSIELVEGFSTTNIVSKLENV